MRNPLWFPKRGDACEYSQPPLITHTHKSPVIVTRTQDLVKHSWHRCENQAVFRTQGEEEVRPCTDLQPRSLFALSLIMHRSFVAIFRELQGKQIRLREKATNCTWHLALQPCKKKKKWCTAWVLEQRECIKAERKPGPYRDACFKGEDLKVHQSGSVCAPGGEFHTKEGESRSKQPAGH